MDYEMVEHNTTLREKKFILFSVKKKKRNSLSVLPKDK